MIRSPQILVLFAPLAGCAVPDVSAPSLLPRPIEGRSEAEPERPAPVATPDPALDAKIAALVTQRAKAGSDFVAAEFFMAASKRR